MMCDTALESPTPSPQEFYFFDHQELIQNNFSLFEIVIFTKSDILLFKNDTCRKQIFMMGFKLSKDMWICLKILLWVI